MQSTQQRYEENIFHSWEYVNHEPSPQRLWGARKFEVPIDLVAALWIKFHKGFASDEDGPIGRVILPPAQHDGMAQQHAEQPQDMVRRRRRAIRPDCAHTGRRHEADRLLAMLPPQPLSTPAINGLSGRALGLPRGAVLSPPRRA